MTNYLNFVLMSIQILPDIPLKADVRKKHENRISLQRFLKRRVQRRVHGQENRVRLKRNPGSALSLASFSHSDMESEEGRGAQASTLQEVAWCILRTQA